MKLKYMLVLVVAVVTAIGVVVASSGAQAPGARTLVFKETEGQGRFLDEKPLRKGSIGDRFAFSNKLFDAAGKRVGDLQAVCTVTKVIGKNKLGQMCQGAARLSDGDLLLEAAFTDNDSGPVDVKGAITGGTGAYANARGTFTSAGAEVSTDTFTFTQ